MAVKKRTYILVIIGLVLFLVGAIGGWLYKSAYKQYDGPTAAIVLIPENSDKDLVEKILTDDLGEYGKDVYRMWSLRGAKTEKAPGYYVVQPGDKAWSVASRILSGQSSTVRVSFNSVRTIKDLAGRIAKYFPWSEKEFIEALDSVLPMKGYVSATYPGAFIPDSYDFYGNATPEDVVDKLSDYTAKFWNSSRLQKAEKLGLNPVEVHTVASIVEEEANDPEERSRVASLYLNRLRKGMKLQADPTVKFAIGDFSLRRITGEHLKFDSPYNTYLASGLPPGPIRVAEARTIDAVLNAPHTDYIYMCADETRPGFHNFTADYNTHLANARRYWQWLNERGIK